MAPISETDGDINHAVPQMDAEREIYREMSSFNRR